MRLINFLSKFAFICNIAFVLFVFFRWMEMRKPVDTAAVDRVVEVPFFKDLIITLGFCAIIINLLVNIFYFLFLVKGKLKTKQVWLPLINFIFLVVQFFYFFVY